MHGRQQYASHRIPGVWLTTVASRICLDLLGSARARRERYVGEWIPEPLLDAAGMRERMTPLQLDIAATPDEVEAHTTFLCCTGSCAATPTTSVS